MFELLAVMLATAALVTGQDMTAIVTSASDTDLLAYTTITTACLPAVDPNSEPIFSIQTDTNIESCTYVVNADNTAQVVSTIGATAPPALADTSSTDVPLSTIVGTNTESMSGPPITSSTTVSAESSAATDESSAMTSESSNTPDSTTTQTIAAGGEASSASSQPAATPTDGGAGRIAMGGEAFGVVGLMAVLAVL